MDKEHYPPHHHTVRLLKRSLVKKLFIIWLVLLSVTVVGAAIGFKKYINPTSPLLSELLNQKLEEQKQQQQTHPQTTQTYRSDLFGYEIIFNPQILHPDRSTDLNQPNLSELRFSLSGTDNPGFGFVDFTAQPSTVVSTIEKDKTLEGKDLIEKAANWYQKNRLKDLTDTSQFVSKERIKRWDTDSYKLTYKRHLFGKDVLHFSYIVIKNNKLYTVLTDYPKFGGSADLIEGWLDQISFFDPSNPESLVKAATDHKPNLDEVKLVELNKPSVVQIISINCVTITTTQTSKSHYLKPKYDICNGGGGTGFMISKDGYVATNGHVAKASFEDLVVTGRAEPGSGEFAVDFMKEIMEGEGAKSVLTSPDDNTNTSTSDLIKKYPSILDALFQKVNEYITQGIIAKPQYTDRYFVKLGSDPIRFAKTSTDPKAPTSLRNLKPQNRTKTILDAQLIDYNFNGLTALQQSAALALAGIPQPKKEKSSDIAIIKLKGPANIEYPKLPLVSSTQAKEGQSILVVGYPGLVSGQDPSSAGLLDETSSSVRPTITRGIISAVKQDTYGQTLLQTDASIEHGNSGGPAFLYDGDVIGIATYVISSGSGNYNFLRATDDLFALLAKNQINKDDQSQSYTYWKDGLNFFWNSEFTRAKEQFAKVKEMYPLHPQVDEYIANSQKGIDAGEDVDTQSGKTPQGQKIQSRSQSQIIWFIVALVLSMFAIGAGISIYLIYDHRRKANAVIEQQATPLPPVQN